MTKRDSSFWEDWPEIRTLCLRVGRASDSLNKRYPPGLFATRNHRWLIGPCFALQRVAAGLSWNNALHQNEDPELEKALRSNNVRFGGRSTDRPPDVDGPKSIGPLKPARDLSDEQKAEVAKRQQPGRAPFRKTDVHPAVAAYWRGMTLEVHHIVEKELLGYLGLNMGILADDVAPCVLVHAELHRRLFTPTLARANTRSPGEGSLRDRARERAGQDSPRRILEEIYDGFYNRPEMEELAAIARIIISRLPL